MDFNKVKQLENQYYMHTFGRAEVCFTHGVGNKLYDCDGKEYTDFTAGIAVNLLGYGDRGYTDAVCEQAKKLVHCSNLYYNEPQSRLAEMLVTRSPFERVFFGNSGAEANECAIKLARAYFAKKGEKNRSTIVCATGAFHGRTLATLAATGQKKYSEPFEPLPTGFKHIPYNDVEALGAAVDGSVAALMLEPIQGESGVTPAAKEYLAFAEKLCREKGIFLILDEVQTGMGRTGSLFCFEQYGITPDIATLAKGIAGGIPLGACLARGVAAEVFTSGDHGSTFGGGPLACAAACYVLEKVSDKAFLGSVRSKGERLLSKLSTLTRHACVREVRGMGLMVGLELQGVKNSDAAAAMRSEGYLIATAGTNTLRFIPPLTISEEEIDAVSEKLDNLFANLKI